MQSKATNSSRLSAYHFVLKRRMTNAHKIRHHISASASRRRARLPQRIAETGRPSRRRTARLGHSQVGRTCGRRLNAEREWGAAKRFRGATVAGSKIEGRRADQKRSVESTPEASCIQFSRLYRCEAGDLRDADAAKPFHPACTTTYYI